jgi:lipopolysaccharide/colanic/teichoic acid biosynthesis glycosyltransferase
VSDSLLNIVSPSFQTATEDFVNLDHLSNPGILAQEPFMRMLCVERKRTERSHRRFVLMLLAAGTLLKPGNKGDAFDKVLYALSRYTRETDIKGWYKEGSVIGVIFTEIGTAEGRAVANALLGKVTNALCSVLSIEQINEVSLSFHVFPEDVEKQAAGGSHDSVLYPELVRRTDPQKASLLVKRSIDIVGSLSALILSSPLLLAICAAIKLTSKGPIFFRQERLGQYGRRFTFLKFRTMYFRSDHAIHKEYVTRFISGEKGAQQNAGTQPAFFKLKADPRVTAIGRLLRRTSLDELPQFLNVLLGEMSLVGPRPPVQYEFDAYDVWHKRRVLVVKPGITGLWQVEGRSRVTFDEMVRLDFRYAASWSLWLDAKILLRTPMAVLSGAGAC